MTEHQIQTQKHQTAFLNHEMGQKMVTQEPTGFLLYSATDNHGDLASYLTP